jgi:glycosyltransferase involved in cell wall biosynthesis
MHVSSPLVSVVIPTCKRPALLQRALHSVFSQTLQEIEVIVVIDGHDQNQTVDALSGFQDSRLRVVCLPDPVGGAEARNVGIRNARSSWIALLDDDDEWLPSKLQAQIGAVPPAANQRFQVVTSQYIHRAEGSPDVLRPRRLPRFGERPYEFVFDYLCYFQTSTFLCSRELMLACPFTKDLPFFHDIDWFLRAFRNFDPELIVVPQPLSIYYAPRNRASVSTRVDWSAKVQWGRANRHLLTKRAYSRFIVGSCAGSAVQDKAGLRGFTGLFYECAVNGSPTPELLLLLCGTFLFPPQLRKKLRDVVLLRRADLGIATQRTPVS